MPWGGEEDYWRIPPPSVPQPPSGGGGPPGNVQTDQGYNPDWRSLIGGSPIYQAWKNNSTLDLNQAAAQRRAQLRSLVVRYGGLGQFQDTYGDIDQGTLDLASRNEFSDVKRAQRNYQQGVERFKKVLAARQVTSSGELQFGLDNADSARAQNEYDLGNEFSNQAGSAIQGYLGIESALRRGELDALIAASQSVFADPANRTRPASQANLIPNSERVMGYPAYEGQDGSLWWINPQTGRPERHPWDMS